MISAGHQGRVTPALPIGPEAAASGAQTLASFRPVFVKYFFINQLWEWVCILGGLSRSNLSGSLLGFRPLGLTLKPAIGEPPCPCSRSHIIPKRQGSEGPPLHHSRTERGSHSSVAPQNETKGRMRQIRQHIFCTPGLRPKMWVKVSCPRGRGNARRRI
jgi:hypothetical protein